MDTKVGNKGGTEVDDRGREFTWSLGAALEEYKGMFGKNGIIPLGDQICRKQSILSLLRRKEMGHFYGVRERNRCIQTGTKHVLVLSTT